MSIELRFFCYRMKYAEIVIAEQTDGKLLYWTLRSFTENCFRVGSFPQFCSRRGARSLFSQFSRQVGRTREHFARMKTVLPHADLSNNGRLDCLPAVATMTLTMKMQKISRRNFLQSTITTGALAAVGATSMVRTRGCRDYGTQRDPHRPSLTPSVETCGKTPPALWPKSLQLGFKGVESPLPIADEF